MTWEKAIWSIKPSQYLGRRLYANLIQMDLTEIGISLAVGFVVTKYFLVPFRSVKY